MNVEQVFLAWGSPIDVSRERGKTQEVWTYSRGDTLLAQMRNRTIVYFSGDQVMWVDDEP